MFISKLLSRLPAVLVLILILPCICFSSSSEITSISQLNNACYRVGSDAAGPVHDRVVEFLPNTEILKFRTFLDEYFALQNGKIDALTCNEPEFIAAMKNGVEGTRILPGTLGTPIPIAAGISEHSKIPGLKEKFNAFIAELKADGTLSAMYKRWVYDGETKMPEIDVPEKSDIHLTIGTTGVVMPFSFYINSNVTGFDIELSRRFAAHIGAEIEFKVYDFFSILMALKKGNIDIALSNLYATAERGENISFSDTIFTVNCIAVVRDEGKSPAPAKNETGNFEAFRGKRIGVFTGSVQHDMVKKAIPGAEISYFDSTANIIASLKSGKIDAVAVDETTVTEIERANPDLTHIDENIGEGDTAFLLPKSPKNNPLADEVNEYIRRIKSDGTLDEIRAVWSGEDESKKIIPDYSKLPAEKGTLRIAANDVLPVFSYVKDGKLMGYDVDVIVRFCKEKGYRPDFSMMNFPGVIPAVMSGKCDMGLGGITITPERSESVRFSETLYSFASFLVIQKPDAPRPAAEKQLTISDFNGKTIAVNSGTIHVELIREILPSAKILLFNGITDTFAAVTGGKADAIADDEVLLEQFIREHNNCEFVDGYLKTFDNAFIFAKNEDGAKLCGEFSEFLNSIKSDGTFERLKNIWRGDDESLKTLPDYESYPDTNGVINVAVYAEIPPFDYMKEGRLAGYEVDLVTRFCKEKGYRPKFIIGNFDSIIPSVVQGKCQIGLGSISITEERSQSVNFSSPTYTGGTRLMILKSQQKNENSPIVGIPKYKSLADFDGKTIGMQPGIIDWENWVAENLPNSKVLYYNTYPDLASALKTHKIEGFLVDSPVLALMAAEDKTLTAVDEPVGKSFGYSFVYAKKEAGKKLCDEMSEYLRKIKASGELDAILSKWQGADENAKIPPDFKRLPAKNGTLTYAAEGAYPPFTYYKGTKLAGIDIDIVVRFCEAYGYGLDVQTMLFDAMLPAVNAGKVDFAGDFTPSEEHEEAVYYSEPYCMAYSVMAFLKAEDSPAQAVTPKLSDFDGKPVGIQAGVPALEAFARKFFPHSQVQYYNTYTDIAAAVKAGKIASFIVDSPVLELMSAEDPRIVALDENIDEGYDIAYGFPKTEAGRKLCGEMSEYIRGLKAGGELQVLINRWTGTDESAKNVPDYKKFPAPKGVLRMATEGEYAPMNYFKGNAFAGIDIDLAVRFCQANGYGLEITPMNYAAIVPAVASGKFDFAGADLNPTPENVDVLNFSEPYYRSSHVVAYLQGYSQPKPTELDSLAGKRIGVQTGTTCAELVPERIPSAKLSYYDSLTDELTALRAGKVDAICCSLPAAIFTENADPKLVRINPPLRETYLYPIFADNEKGKRLCDEYSAFLKTLWDNGTIDRLNEKWLGPDESGRTVDDYSKFPNTNGSVKMAVDTSLVPFAYIKDNKIVGYDVDLAVMFCKAKGYSLEVENMSLTGVIASVKSGKSDFTQSLNKTPEREENTIFTSTPAIKSGNVLITMKPRQQEETLKTEAAVTPSQPGNDEPSFWEDVALSFRKTFIRENRWKLFAEGIINTMIITVSSIFCGMILGFIAFMFCRTGSKIANGITKFSVWLIKGTPIVVLVMILYYIIFGHVNISGIIVSIIAFTLTFGTSVYRMLTFGTGAVDRGQTEAAYALGFTEIQTFFIVILPQAALHFMPSFKEEVTMLIKSTSIVGYIAVQDLTKMGDIVRSRTYEAFFPLIAVAVIYFILAGILNIIVNIIHVRITPSKRKPEDILRGIDTAWRNVNHD